MPRVKTYDEEEVLNRALELFWKKGFHDTSMQDLVDHLKISRAGIYSSFTDKATLFEKALEQYISGGFNQMKAYFSNRSDTKQALVDFFMDMASESDAEAGRRGCFVVNSTTELALENGQVRTTLATHRTRVVELFKEVITQAQANNEISKDKNPEVLASLLYTHMNGIRVISRFSNEPNDIQKTTAEMLKILD